MVNKISSTTTTSTTSGARASPNMAAGQPMESADNSFYVDDQLRPVPPQQLVSIAAVAAGAPTTQATVMPKTELAIQTIKAEPAHPQVETTTSQLCGLSGATPEPDDDTSADSLVGGHHHVVPAGLNHNNNHLDLPKVPVADLDLKGIKTETSSSLAFDGLSELLMANGSTGDLNLDALDPIDTWESGSSSSGGSTGSHFEFACTQDEVSDMLSDIGVSAEADWVDNLIAI